MSTNLLGIIQENIEAKLIGTSPKINKGYLFFLFKQVKKAKNI